MFKNIRYLYNMINTLNSDIDNINSNFYLNYYYILQAYSTSPSLATHNFLEGRKLSNFDWLIAYVCPSGSIYTRGFAIIPTAKFISDGGIECNFLNGLASNYADIKYVSDTQAAVGTSSTYGHTIYLLGIAIGRVL